MPALPAACSPCIEEAIARAQQWMTRAIDYACTQLEEESRRASGAQRQELAQAQAELAQQRVDWCAAIPGALRRAIASGDSPRKPRVRISPSSLTLTLVDDDEVMKNIESSRLAMELATLVEKPLAELDKYMSAALGLESIQPEENPLRPGVFAQALRSVMNEADPLPGRPALWMRHMAEPLAAELVPLYEICTKLLIRAKVRPADYRITSPAPLRASGTASSPTPLERDSRAGSGVVPLRTQDARARSGMSGWIELATQAIGGPALREFLFGGSQQQAQQPLAPAYYRQVDEELAALEARWDEAPPDPRAAREYQHLPVVDRPVRVVGTDSPLNREVWGDFGAPRQRSLVRTRLRKEAKQVGQVMGLDVVRQLVDQVAQDPRLLAPVREAMVVLEPSLARLAMHSPRFFGEADNPARKLLEAVAQRSFKFNDEFSTEFRDFFDGVTQCFTGLNRDESLVDAQPFERALGELERGWSSQDQEDEHDRAQVIESVQFAEKRQAEADRIAWELSQRSDMDGAPAVVQDFIYGPWALVIAHVRLANTGADMDPGGYIRVIADLLWSVKRETTLRDPARAFDIIPRVLPKLRAGLDLLGHPASETQSFFHALERLHRPVLRLRAKHRHASVHAELAAAPLDYDLLPAPAQKPQEHENLWMREGELRACGFEDTLPSDYAALEPEAPPPAAALAPERPASAGAIIPVKTVAGVPIGAPQADALIASLQEGQWVDLFSKHRWRRAQLTWASGRRTLFMFVSHGGRPHSMTQRSLQRLVMNRLLRPVDSHEVVQHALDALARPHSEPLAA